MDRYEIAVATFFESRSLNVERLCTSWLPEGGLSPDFRVTSVDAGQFLCEVKHILSSTAALTETDWRYNNTQEYERLITESGEQRIPLIALPDQIAFWKNEIPYPKEGRNTKQKEREYERKVRKALGKLPIALGAFEITVHRHDPFIWRDQEIQQFVDDLAQKLQMIISGQLPHDWHCDFGLYTGHYRQLRDHDRFIHNFIEVRHQGHNLVLNCKSYLGINWQKIEKHCHEAQGQIKYRLRQEHEPQHVGRVVIVFMEENLVFEYLPEFDKLKHQLRRHIQTKSSELSAVAFCSEPIRSDPENLQFTVFHVAQEQIPKLAESVFNNGASMQMDL